MYCIVILLLALAACCAVATDPLPPPARETFNCTADGSRWPYLIQPAPGETKAILINLYGHYSDEYQGMTEGIYNDAFGKLRRECLKRNWVYVCPWYGGNSWMGPLGEAGMAQLIGILKKRWPDVPVIVEGGSMGGSSVLVFAAVRPDLVDGVIARCPASDIESYYAFAKASSSATLQNIADAIRIHYTVDGHDLQAELRKRSALLNAERLTMPVHLSHGDRDSTIPVDATRKLAARLRELGRRVQYVEIPGGDHDSPVNAVGWAEAMDFVTAEDAPE